MIVSPRLSREIKCSIKIIFYRVLLFHPFLINKDNLDDFVQFYYYHHDTKRNRKFYISRLRNGMNR